MAVEVASLSFTGKIIGMTAGGTAPNSKSFQILVSDGTAAKSFLVVADLKQDEPGTAEGKMIVAAAAYSKGVDVKISWSVERNGVPVVADIQFPPS